MPCHSQIKTKGVPAWKVAEQKLKVVADNVHAIDLHPFASFLTTLNVLFMALPLYAVARKQDPDFTIDFHIFSADSLERPDRKTEQQMHMFDRMNSRIQLSADSYDRYRRIMDTKFDHVFGNPPWGGVLKGRLAPVYDSVKKKHFATVYPNAAKGKYDIYGLFLERSLQLLKKDGSFALLTQSTYLDKEWAGKLREHLASHSELRWIVDLNPFGQLFFHAMNSPCITVGVKCDSDGKNLCSCLISHHTKEFQGVEIEERREKVVATVRAVLARLQSKKRAQISFASGARVEQVRFQETAADRWDLSGGPTQADFPTGWFTAAELLEMRQGVTPGGCLDIFLMEKKKADLLKLEGDLVHNAIKSRQLERWAVEWKKLSLFYPYHVHKGNSEPAFTVHFDEIEDEQLKQRLMELKISDALDFDQQVDSREVEIVREAGINEKTVPRLLKHRISLGLIEYTEAAAYLIQNYDRLQGRIFKKRNIRTFARQWYEYLWPRDPKIMLGKPRILSPSLVRTVRFVFDGTGYLSDHACLMIQPTAKRAKAWDKFSDEMKELMGESMSKKELLQYCLAFMNSEYAQDRLVSGHRPTPKGSYQITESFLREIPIPKPTSRKSVRSILKLVGDIEEATTREKTTAGEKQLNELIAELLNA